MLQTRNTIQPILWAFCAAIGVCALAGRQPIQGAAPVKDLREVKAAEPIQFPDGVLDAERHTAFVSSPKGGIQAIRLEDGKVLWTNDDCAAQPWLVAGNRLIARGERIFVLDIKNDGKQKQCDALEFPKVEVPDRCTVSFPLWDPRVVGDTLEAKWYAVANIDRSKGRPFNFQGWTSFNKAVPAGTVKINLDTGKATVQTDANKVDVSMGLMPEGAKPDKQMPGGLPEKLAAVWQEYHKDQNGRITVIGDRVVGVALTLEKKGQEYTKIVTLHAWDLKTGTAAEPTELLRGKALDIANIMLTEDRRHAAVQFSTSAFNLYTLTDGKLVAKDMKGVVSPERAFVDGKRLYFSQQTPGGALQAANTLKALDLESGKVVWERALKPHSTMPLPP